MWCRFMQINLVRSCMHRYVFKLNWLDSDELSPEHSYYRQFNVTVQTRSYESARNFLICSGKTTLHNTLRLITLITKYSVFLPYLSTTNKTPLIRACLESKQVSGNRVIAQQRLPYPSISRCHSERVCLRMSEKFEVNVIRGVCTLNQRLQSRIIVNN